MTGLNYTRPTVPETWCQSHGTHPAVASAIHALADSSRSPEAIWEAPTAAEWDHVTMAVQSYVAAGYYPADDTFRWGNETVTI